MHKADLSQDDGVNPTEVLLDETVIWIDGQQILFLAVVDPLKKNFPHTRLFPATAARLTEIFLGELRENTI